MRESARLFVGGFPLAVTPGKVGEVLKAVWIQQKTGIPTARGVAVVVAERISDGLAVLLLSTVGVIASPQYWPAFAVSAGAAAGGRDRLADPPAGAVPARRRGAAARGQALRPRLREFYEGSFTLFRPGATLLAVGLGMISWLGEGIGMYLILRGLGVPGGWQTLLGGGVRPVVLDRDRGGLHAAGRAGRLGGFHRRHAGAAAAPARRHGRGRHAADPPGHAVVRRQPGAGRVGFFAPDARTCSTWKTEPRGYHREKEKRHADAPR